MTEVKLISEYPEVDAEDVADADWFLVEIDGDFHRVSAKAFKDLDAEQFTVSGLPSASDYKGRIVMVTDAKAPDPSEPVSGGGAVSVPVFSTGAAWYPMGAPEDLTGMPPYPPYALTLTQFLTAFGHSFIAKQTTRTCITDLLDDHWVFGVVDNEGISGQTMTQIANRVDNTDATIVDTAAGLTRAQQVAGYVILDMLRNTATKVPGTVIMPGAYADRNRAIACFTNAFLLLTDQTGRSFPIGNAVWAQCMAYRRKTMADYPNQTVDWTWTLQQYADGGNQDAIDLYYGCVPTSTRTYDDGSVDDTHPGTRGNKIMAYGPIWHWLNCLELASVFVPPFHEAYITGAAADTAITTSGHVYNTPHLGTGGTFSLVSGDATKFAVNAATGEITCVAAFTPTLAWYDLKVRLTKGNMAVDCVVRLWIGKNTRACDDRPVGRDIGGPIVFADAPSGIASKAFSAAFCLSPGAATNGKKMFLLGSESSSIQLYRDTDNKVKLIVRNSAGAIIASLASTTTWTVADGFRWVTVSIDLNPGSPVARLYFNSTDSLAGSPTLTQGATVDWNKRAVILSDSPTLTNCWEGTFRAGWIATSYVDWSSSTRRDELFNSGTLAAVVLAAGGVCNSVTPLYWMPGSLADLYCGRAGTGQNAGSGPAGVGCARDYPNPGGGGGQQDGNFTPTDLGSKLKYFLSRADHGTANMTTETGERVTAWIDRTAGVTLSQASGSTARPTYDGNYNAEADEVVRVNGAQYLDTTSLGSLISGSTASRTFIGAHIDGAQSGTVWTRGTSAGSQLRRITVDANFRPVVSDGTVSTSVPADIVWTGAAVVGARFSTAGHTLRFNSSQVSVSGAAPGMATGTTRMRVGANLATTAANLISGAIEFIIETDDTITTDEMQKIEAWIAWEMKRPSMLSITNPYREYRP